MSEVNERTTTEYYDLILPQYDEVADIADINDNMETIDEALHDLQGEVDEAVMFTEQSLTTGQKTQARTNIGAMGPSDLLVSSTKIDLTWNSTEDPHCATSKAPTTIDGFTPIAIVGWEVSCAVSRDYKEYVNLSKLNFHNGLIYVEARITDHPTVSMAGGYSVFAYVLYKKSVTTRS